MNKRWKEIKDPIYYYREWLRRMGFRGTGD